MQQMSDFINNYLICKFLFLHHYIFSIAQSQLIHSLTAHKRSHLNLRITCSKYLRMKQTALQGKQFQQSTRRNVVDVQCTSSRIWKHRTSIFIRCIFNRSHKAMFDLNGKISRWRWSLRKAVHRYIIRLSYV